jgi:hypothetical protein
MEQCCTIWKKLTMNFDRIWLDSVNCWQRLCGRDQNEASKPIYNVCVH